MPVSSPSSQFFPKVAIFSEYSSLTSKIIERIINSGCKVVVICNEPYRFLENKHEISDMLSIVEQKHFITNVRVDYLLYIDYLVTLGNLATKSNYPVNYLELISKIIKSNDCKSLSVFPYQISQSHFNEEKTLLDMLSGVVKSTLFIGNCEDQLLFENKIIKSDKYYFRDDDVVSREIVRSLFSFGGQKTKSTLLANHIKRAELEDIQTTENELVVLDEIENTENYRIDKNRTIENLHQLIKNDARSELPIHKFKVIEESAPLQTQQEAKHDFSINNFELPSQYTETNLKKSRNYLKFITTRKKNKTPRQTKFDESPSFFLDVAKPVEVSSALKRVKKYKVKTSWKFNKNKGHKYKIPKNLNKYAVTFVSLIFIFLSFPYLIMVTTFVILFLHLNFNIDILYVRQVSNIGLAYSSKMFRIPHLQSIYSPSYQSLLFMNKFSEIKIEKDVLNVEISNLFVKIFSSESIDKNIYSSISSSYEKIYTLSSFIKAESTNDTFGILHNLDDTNKNYALWRFSSNFSSLMGEESIKNYALVLVDDTKLKPSGGVPKSVVTISISNGKVISYKADTVAELDSRLNGFVELPDEMLIYLPKETSWNLSQSFWFTDFEDSAKAALWFIEKEDKVKLDGLIAINSSYLDKVLNEFDLYIDETDEKKLLTIVTDIIRNRENIDKSKSMFIEGIVKRHINMYFVDTKIQDSVKNIIDSNIYNRICDDRCVDVTFGFAESVIEPSFLSNMSRKSEVDVNIEGETMTVSYDTLLTNNLSTNISGTYDGLVNLVLPINSKMASLSVNNELTGKKNIKVKTLQDDNKTLNIFEISVLPNETVTISVVFQLQLATSEMEGLSLRFIQQPGIESYPISFKLKSKEKNITLVNTNGDLNSDLSLTNEGIVSYNSPTSHDFLFELLWK